MFDLDLDADLPLRPGQRVELRLAIRVHRGGAVRYIDLRLVGTQWWGALLVPTSRYPDLACRLMDGGVLAAGRHTLTATFELPADLPPTYEIEWAWSHLHAEACVAFPFWSDVDARWRLSAWPLPSPSVEPAPAVVSTGPLGAARLEVSLASNRLVAGQAATGTCNLVGLAGFVPSSVELSLIPVIRISPSEATECEEVCRHVISVPDTSAPFSLEIPGDTAPSYTAPTHALEWQLGARAGKLAVRIPLGISAGAVAMPAPVQPRDLGEADEPAKYAFDDFAKQHGWREVDVREPDEVLAIQRQAETATLRLSLVDRAEGEPRVAAWVVHRPLGLGLNVTPRSRFLERWLQAVESDLMHWDRTHGVVANTATQAVPFLRGVVPTLLETAAVLGELAHWSDAEIVFERSTANPRVSELAAAEVALERVAAAIGRAPIAPPPGLAVDLDAWRELAHALRGELVVGDLSIRGALDQRDVAITLNLPEQPVAISVRVGPAAALPDLVLALERPAADAEREPVPEPIRALLARWPEDFVDLRIRHGIASALWGISEARADAARVRELVRALRAVIAALESGAGPYR